MAYYIYLYETDSKRPYHFIIKVCIVILTRWSEEIS